MDPYVPKPKSLEKKIYEIRLMANDMPYAGEMIEVNVKEKFLRMIATKSPSIGNRCEWQIHCPNQFTTNGTGSILSIDEVKDENKSFKKVKIKILQLVELEVQEIENQLIQMQKTFATTVNKFRGGKIE